MREVILRVPRAAVEDVLDRLLLIVPQGVREVPAGRHVDLKVRGDDLPSHTELRKAVGRWPLRISENQVADDWRERRAADYVPDLIGGRLVVRPEWAPAAGAEIEILLEESAAFGAGTHPTTRTCLELLLEIPVGGAFADLGCGSGVLAILAAKLGWAPVHAVDVQSTSVESARQNAERNGVAVEASQTDLSTSPPPPATGFAANVPAGLHQLLAGRLLEPPPRTGLLSGFSPTEAPDVAAAYAARNLDQRRRVDIHGWTVVLLGR